MTVGDDVFVRYYHGGERWLPGVIVKRTGPVSFLVRLADDGRNSRCQVRVRSVDAQEDVIPEPEVMPEFLPHLVTPTPSVSSPTETPNSPEPILSEVTDATPPIDRTEKSYS